MIDLIFFFLNPYLLLNSLVEERKTKSLVILRIDAHMNGQNQGEEVWIAIDGVEGLFFYT